MQVGKVVKGVKIPERINRGVESKYPINDLTVGAAFPIVREKNDPDLKTMKKRIVNSIRQVEKRLGKTATGKKVKEFAVWMDVKQNTVFVGLREDNSAEKKATAKKPVSTVTKPATAQVKPPVSKPPMARKTPVAKPVATPTQPASYTPPPPRKTTFTPNQDE